MPQFLLEVLSKDELYNITKPIYKQIKRKDSKIQILEKIQKHISPFPENLAELKKQLAIVLPYGKNKQVYFKNLNTQSRFVLQKLSENRWNEILTYCNITLNDEDLFNDLLNDNPTDFQVLYFKVDKEISNNTTCIELCIYKDIVGKNDDELYNYVWIKMNVDEGYLTVHVNPQDSLMVSLYTTRSLFKEILQKIESIFRITLSENMLFAREKLFLIYSEYIKKFEEPYKNRVDSIDDLIQEHLTPVAQALDLNQSTSNQLLSRYKTLLERFLIINKVDTPEEFEREGIINKFAISDQSGGKATLLNADDDQGIDVSNLYLDIRDTLDEVKQLDKLWVDWIRQIPAESDADLQISLDLGQNFENTKRKYERIRTFLDVSQDALVISFMRDHYVTKGDVDYVLKKITEFIQS